MVKQSLTSLLTAGLMVLAFPNFDLWPLAWFGLVPLLLGLGRNPIKSFFLSLICGVLFWSGLVYWLMNVPNYTVLHYIILMPYLGLFWGLFGLLFSYISKRHGASLAYLAAPFIWVGLDLLRSHFFWLALPWGMLGYSQYLNLPTIQIASITGAYGVSFIVVAVNCALSLGIDFSYRRWKLSAKSPRQTSSGWAVAATILVSAGLVAGSLIYGHMVISRPLAGDKIKVAIVQSNIPQNKKWDASYAETILQIHSDLTRQAAEEKPALIAWPETATPSDIGFDRRMYSRVLQVVRQAQVPLLVGSAERRKYELEGMPRSDHKNSAHLLIPEGRKITNQKYDKIHLLPFGEYLPASNSIPWGLIGVKAVSGYTPGQEFTVFDLGSFRFSAPICWESIFPDLVRQFVKNGAQLLVNITNAAYFGRTSAPYQVLSMSVFRAVENRVFWVCAGNIGVSCIIDPNGQVVDRVKDSHGEDIYTRGYLTGTIIPQDSKTFYTLHGDVFAWACVGISIVVLIVALLRPKERIE
jgi:apolipoprotein N-acyltransferase